MTRTRDAADGVYPISSAEFDEMRRIVYRHFGITLSDQKRALVAGRLQRVLRERGCANIGDYCKMLLADPTGAMLSELASRISTNHTYFWRENAHFDHFRTAVLPEMIERQRRIGDKDIRVWSAGCSSGEEPAQLVMFMMEHLGREYSQWKAGILATDISAQVLAKAMRGVYAAESVNRMPQHLRMKYFSSTPDGDMLLSEEVRREILYRRLNLINDRFPFKKRFHVIFCRNVMIYFDQPTRDELVARFWEHTIPGGYLFIGHSESLGRGKCPYDYVMPAVYRKPEQS